MQARVRQNCDQSYMDSTYPIARTNRFAICICVHASLTNVTERFYENKNVQNSRSPYGWKKRVEISNRREWPWTFSPDVWEVDNSHRSISFAFFLKATTISKFVCVNLALLSTNKFFVTGRRLSRPELSHLTLSYAARF